MVLRQYQDNFLEYNCDYMLLTFCEMLKILYFYFNLIYIYFTMTLLHKIVIIFVDLVRGGLDVW